MSIGELSRLSGIPASAIRYYEEIGVLSHPARVRGRRVFGEADLDRLLVVSFAKEAGFSLREVRQLFRGFASETSAGMRWKALAESKLADLDVQAARLEAMRKLLKEALRCGCVELESCGRLFRGFLPERRPSSAGGAAGELTSRSPHRHSSRRRES